MAIQTTRNEANAQLTMALARFERGANYTASNPRDAGTISDKEFASMGAGVSKEYRALDKQIYAAAKRTADGQVGIDDIAQVVSASKGAVTKAVGKDNLLSAADASTSRLKAVLTAAIKSAQLSGEGAGNVSQKG